MQEDTDPDLVAFASRDAPEIQIAINALWAVHTLPELAEVPEVGSACHTIALWAEANGMMETAVQFAELAARLELDSSVRSFTAGRLCRRKGEHQRAAIWYRRAARLGRLAGNLIDLANAQLGLGNLEFDLGHHGVAETHYLRAARAALRNGRRSLAAAAFHNLVAVTYELGRKSESLQHLKRAADYYRVDHPRFPGLVYDAGFFLMREGHFSSALPLFEQILPHVEGQRMSVYVRSALARSAAAVRDHIRFQRQASAVLGMVAVAGEGSANALYQLAEGARSFADWERAHALATRALDLALKRRDEATARVASALLQKIASRTPGDVDRVPLEGDAVEAVTERLLQKLRKLPAPQVSRVVPPEWYPTE
ncbi:MAG TPA: tetratricopeptide repeat protein [Longimicrobium sp.]|nr:tetratricopeptide repeat protein [Longimicrobium sp.]